MVAITYQLSPFLTGMKVVLPEVKLLDSENRKISLSDYVFILAYIVLECFIPEKYEHGRIKQNLSRASSPNSVLPNLIADKIP